jgi:hypothetical protein
MYKHLTIFSTAIMALLPLFGSLHAMDPRDGANDVTLRGGGAAAGRAGGARGVGGLAGRPIQRTPSLSRAAAVGAVARRNADAGAGYYYPSTPYYYPSPDYYYPGSVPQYTTPAPAPSTPRPPPPYPRLL